MIGNEALFWFDLVTYTCSSCFSSHPRERGGGGAFQKKMHFHPHGDGDGTGRSLVKLCSVVANEGGRFHAAPEGCFQWYHLICFGNSASATCRARTQAEAQTADMSSAPECKRYPGGGRCRGAASASKGSLTAGGRKEIIRNGGTLTGHSTHACTRTHALAHAHARAVSRAVSHAGTLDMSQTHLACIKKTPARNSHVSSDRFSMYIN